MFPSFVQDIRTKQSCLKRLWVFFEAASKVDASGGARGEQLRTECIDVFSKVSTALLRIATCNLQLLHVHNDWTKGDQRSTTGSKDWDLRYVHYICFPWLYLLHPFSHYSFMSIFYGFQSLSGIVRLSLLGYGRRPWWNFTKKHHVSPRKSLKRQVDALGQVFRGLTLDGSTEPPQLATPQRVWNVNRSHLKVFVPIKLEPA